MSDEISKLVPGFRATVATEVIKHRAVNGAETVEAFARDIDAHRERYLHKLDLARAHTGTTAECDAASREINAIADKEIKRARTNGCVEFSL